MLGRPIHAIATEEHLREIGRITANFALLEDLAARFVWNLLGSNYGQIVTAELSFQRVRAILSSLVRARARDPADVERFSRLLARMAQAEQRRNAIVHSSWGGGEGDRAGIYSRFKITAKESRGLVFHQEDLTPAQLREIADFIAAVTGELLAFELPTRPTDGE